METDHSEIDLTNIRLDGGTQPRAELREDVIAEYAEDMRGGATFPPVVLFFDGAAYWLADGFHRVKAAFRAGRDTICADVRQGTRRDAVLHSVGVNADHGVRRTNADKRRAVLTLLNDEEWAKWSNSEIARRCRVSAQTVANCRKDSSLSKFDSERTYTDKHGNISTMNTANIGQREKASDPDASAKDALAAASERRTARLAAALADAPAPVIQAVRSFGIDEPELVEDLKRVIKSDGKPGSSDTFSEILATGWIQPGDEEEAVHITEGVEKVRAALRQKTGIHIQIGRDIAQADHQLINQSDNNEWYTPARYIKSVHEVLGQVDVDPASNEYANRIIQAKTFYTIDNDGFAQEWPGKVFMNPPYGRDDAGNDSNQARWSRRLIEQYKAGIVTEAILLVNAVPGNRWFAPLWEFPICFVDHRIRFYSRDVEAGQPTHSNAFVYMGPNVDRFAAAFSKHGVIAVQYKPTAEAVELSHVA